MIKTSSEQFWVHLFSKNVSVCWYFDTITNFISRIFFVRIFNVSWFHFYCSLNSVIAFCSHVLKNLVFSRPNKSFSNNIFPFIVCWIHFNVVYFQTPLKKFIVKFVALINPYFIWFASFWDYFLKCINNIYIPFCFSQGTTHTYY